MVCRTEMIVLYNSDQSKSLGLSLWTWVYNSTVVFMPFFVEGFCDLGHLKMCFSYSVENLWAS